MTSSTKRSGHLFGGPLALPAVAKSLREDMKRAGLDLVYMGERDRYGVPSQTGEVIYVGKLADVATWFAGRGRTTAKVPA